jgi:hypothetical protein
MFTVCHMEEADFLPPQLLPRCPVYDTILIWFLILFPVLSNTNIQCKLVNNDGWPLRYNLPQLAVAVAFAIAVGISAAAIAIAAAIAAAATAAVSLAASLS